MWHVGNFGRDCTNLHMLKPYKANVAKPYNTKLSLIHYIFCLGEIMKNNTYILLTPFPSIKRNNPNYFTKLIGWNDYAMTVIL